MHRPTGLITLTLVVLVAPYLLSQKATQKKTHKTPADRAHHLATLAASQHPASCPKPDNLTLKTCHTKFPDGCSQAARPGYDAYLDFLKDQDPGAAAASTKTLGQKDFPALEARLPGKLTDRNHAQFASTTFAGLGEGNIHTVVAYLYFAEDTGAGTKPNSETCNCKLMAAGSFDYHLGIGFDSALATIAKSHPKEGDPNLDKLQKDSVVAEMTPFVRAQHPKWTIDRLNGVEGQQIKVVGQLMTDNDHFNSKDDCGHGNAATCWRSTVWEIHPITQFYVCKASGGCTASSPASDWTNLDDMP